MHQTDSMAVAVNKIAEAEKILLKLGETYKNGFTQTEINKAFPNAESKQNIAKAINELLKKDVVEVLKNYDDVLMYRLKKASSAPKAGLDNEKEMIYKIIERAGNLGVWIKHIREETNINQIKKHLNAMENNKLIKKVKSVKKKNQIVYMLYNLKPDESLVGGIWHNEGEFDEEFASSISSHILNYMVSKFNRVHTSNQSPLEAKRQASATANEVLGIIQQLGIVKVQLTNTDIEDILNALHYEGKLDIHDVSTGKGESEKSYCYRKPLVATSPLVCSPCQFCPVADMCAPGGPYSPENCEYMKAWLDF